MIHGLEELGIASAEVGDSEGRSMGVDRMVSSLPQKQKQALYLTRQLYNYYVNVMEDTKDTYVARSIRDYFVTLLLAAKADCKELIAFLKLPTSDNPNIDLEKGKIMLQHLKKYKELHVDDGEKEANKFLLNYGFMNPKLAQFFNDNMKDDRHFSYPLSRVAPSKISIRGSMEEDEFYKRLNKYGDRFSSNDHHSADKLKPLTSHASLSLSS